MSKQPIEGETMTIDTMDAARRLIRAATGDEYGDGMMVTGIGVGIAEPGYGDSDTVWVAGNWNPKRFRSGDDAPLTNDESRPQRLASALERIGVELLWLDEWTECANCYQAIRTEPDSYSWTPYFLTDQENWEPYCLDCFAQHYGADDSGLYGFGFVDDPSRAVPDSISDSQLIDWGWEQYNGTFESGLYGREDNPADVFDAIKRENSDSKVVFKYGTEQFRVQFTAWVKDDSDDQR